MVPKLPKNSFGNLVVLTDAFRDVVKKIDREYIEALQSTDLLLNSILKLLEHYLNRHTLMMNFTSWCRFPLYETDFGWGKPIWVSTCTIPTKNVIVLMDSNSFGDEIEAYVTLTGEDMVEFEHHDELLALVS
ncbi:hypothetical protein MKW98_028450 [Papaver atlanticum]|uniref:Uncharacterized protein n=1 Tax=Papaver atlanticum TaxID=357466 RepID=A0AAD4TGL0_9MAGN|nr:hypothetical protein MKW98_028450 [Papaver atlanticum]